ncbi:MAG TPA: limonene-1,2-epoxide hydrolase family protein [Acidimicrobiales bacterium]|jgi:limonene-1,2-epoxide hydrolase
MTTNSEMVSDFCEAWPGLNREEIVARFTDDAVYRNIPFPGEIIGGAGVADVLLPISGKLAGIEAKVLNVAERGGLVFAERVEVFRRSTGEVFELPVVGVFELRDGRISAWRDYFDGEQVRPAFA